MAEYCDNPTGMRPVEESEHGGLIPKEKIGGPQATGPVATGKYGGTSGDTAPLTKRGPVGQNSYAGPRKANNGRKLSSSR